MHFPAAESLGCYSSHQLACLTNKPDRASAAWPLPLFRVRYGDIDAEMRAALTAPHQAEQILHGTSPQSLMKSAAEASSHSGALPPGRPFFTLPPGI